MNLTMTWADALPLLLERYYSGKGSFDAMAALRHMADMADMADELADLQERQLMNCGAPYDTPVAGMSINIGG
jgi:hypothetical protein